MGAPTTEPIRLNKYLSQCGIASRRKADELIDAGLVKVNGRKVFELGVKVQPGVDKITVKGKSIQPEKKLYYIAFNKPKHMVTTMSDPEQRPHVGEVFKKFPARLFPVGRLDWDTEGLLLLTNDGEFSQKVSHPKGDVTKTYLAKIKGKPSMEELSRLLEGVSIPGGKVAARQIQKVRGKDSGNNCWVKIVVTEGKNRQVRWMFRKIGYDVLKLKRTAIGKLALANLKLGEFRVLSDKTLFRVFESPIAKPQKARQRSTKRV
jgi:23S rRNA pseudouridine2605 synthase